MADVITNVRTNKSTDWLTATGWGSGTYAGGVNWTNPHQGVYPDGLESTAILSSGVATNYLVANGFRFIKRVPDTATITGIEFNVVKSGDAGLRDYGVSIVFDSEIKTAVNNASLTTVWSSGDSGGNIYKYGSSTNLWGQPITPNDVNDDKSFGIAFAAQNTNASGDARAYVDGFSTKVHYTFGQNEGNAIVGVNRFGNFQSLAPKINRTANISMVEGKYTNKYVIPSGY